MEVQISNTVIMVVSTIVCAVICSIIAHEINKLNGENKPIAGYVVMLIFTGISTAILLVMSAILVSAQLFLRE